MVLRVKQMRIRHCLDVKRQRRGRPTRRLCKSFATFSPGTSKLVLRRSRMWLSRELLGRRRERIRNLRRNTPLHLAFALTSRRSIRKSGKPRQRIVVWTPKTAETQSLCHRRPLRRDTSLTWRPLTARTTRTPIPWQTLLGASFETYWVNPRRSTRVQRGERFVHSPAPLRGGAIAPAFLWSAIHGTASLGNTG